MAERVRIIVLYKRKPGVSKEAADHYWNKEFPHTFKSLKVVHGKKVKYEHGNAHELVTEDLKASFKSLGHVPTFDATAVIEGSSMFELQEIFSSAEYRKVIGEQANKYFEQGSITMFASDTAVLVNQ